MTGSPRFRRLCLGTLLLAAAPLLLGSEKAPPSAPEGLRETVQVILRQVDFLVLGKDEKPITDLRRDEVRVWDEGEEQTLLDFLPAHAPPAAPAPAPAAPVPSESGAVAASPAPAALPPRWVVILFDMRNLSTQARLRAAPALRQLVLQGLRPEDQVALLVDDDELRIVMPFTSERDVLLGHLDRPESLSAMNRDLERRLRDLRDNAEGCREMSDVARCAQQSVDSFLLETSRETEVSLDHLEALIRGLGAIPERKILLYVSDGFLNNPGDVAAAAVEHAIGQIGYNLSAMRSWLSRDYTGRLDRIYRLATSSRVGFYPVNTTRKMTDEMFSPERRTDYGPDNPPQARSDPFEASWQQVQGTHRTLALATGGVATFERDPAGDLLERFRTADAVYTVSYYPTNFHWGKRDIKIKVSRPKARVFYLTTYRPVPDQVARLEGELLVEDATAGSGGGLVRARLKVPGGTFVVAPRSKPPVSVAALFFDLRDAANRPARSLYEVIAFPRGEEGKIVTGVLERPFALRVPPGSYTLVVDVRDINGPAAGSFSKTFTVGGAVASPAATPRSYQAPAAGPAGVTGVGEGEKR